MVRRSLHQVPLSLVWFTVTTDRREATVRLLWVMYNRTHYWQTTEEKLPSSYFDSCTIHTHLRQKRSYHQVALSLVQCLVRTQDWPGSDSWHSQQSTFSWCKVVIDLHANNWGMLRRYLQHPSHWHLKVRAPWSNICLWGVWTRCFVIIRRSQVTSACHGSHEESWEESFSHPLISTPAPATKTH